MKELKIIMLCWQCQSELLVRRTGFNIADYEYHCPHCHKTFFSKVQPQLCRVCYSRLYPAYESFSCSNWQCPEFDIAMFESEIENKVKKEYKYSEFYAYKCNSNIGLVW